MESPLVLGLRVEGEQLRLLSPGVGWFTLAVDEGEVLTPGRLAGRLVTLSRARPLVVPEGVTGVVRSPRPERVREPVGYGSVLYQLARLDARAPGQLGVASAPAAGESARGAESASGASATALLFRSPETGRFWHRPSPAEPALVSEGATIQAGAAIGLIEVMKTFTQIAYRPDASLPARARVVKVLAGDGEDVRRGQPLLELERA